MSVPHREKRCAYSAVCESSPKTVSVGGDDKGGMIRKGAAEVRGCVLAKEFRTEDAGCVFEKER